MLMFVVNESDVRYISRRVDVNHLASEIDIHQKINLWSHFVMMIVILGSKPAPPVFGWLITWNTFGSMKAILLIRITFM